MGKASRQRRDRIAVRRGLDALGQEFIHYRPDDAFMDPNVPLSDAAAEDIVRRLRKCGARLWLHGNPDWTVRLRVQFDEGRGFAPSDAFLAALATLSRPLAKAVARLGEDTPPAANIFGDTARVGGHWVWDPPR